MSENQKDKQDKQEFSSGLYRVVFVALAMSVAGGILADQHFKKHPKIPTKVVELLNDLSGNIQERYGVVHPSLRKSANDDMPLPEQKTR